MSLSPSVENTRTFLNEINNALYVNKLVSLRSSSLFSLCSFLLRLCSPFIYFLPVQRLSFSFLRVEKMQRRYVFFPRVQAPKRKREKSIFAARDDTLFQPQSKLRLDLPANLRFSRDRQVPANKRTLRKQLVSGKYI